MSEDFVRQTWEALRREKGTEEQKVREEERNLLESKRKIEISQARIAEIASFMADFRAFYGGGRRAQAETPPELGGPCPISVEQVRAVHAAGGYPDLLDALALATPGRYLHARTAAKWAMDAGTIPGTLDALRTKYAKHLQRSDRWTKIGRGWHQLQDQADIPFLTEEFPHDSDEDTALTADS